MRRKDREVTDRNEMIDILSRCDTVRLAINDTPVPYIIPMSFGMEDDGTVLKLWFHSATEGRKLDLIRQNPNVSFEADTDQELFYEEEKMNCSTVYSSVIGQGVITFVEGEEKLHGLTCLMAHYHMDPMPINTAVIPRTEVYCLTVTAMTAKQRKKPR